MTRNACAHYAERPMPRQLYEREGKSWAPVKGVRRCVRCKVVLAHESMGAKAEVLP